ncbi:hypothetical protein L596_013639 [Steinernema carpocapsae]|uniref:U4/U6.U5 tri-snRNP-associated protein 1 n=1 Tax=Steinernema carpocapsae TaxID=34508 RepID=A0A4U5P0S7_STECR|nr:hypothetical protein L596_013639 [Steinernema carpocapsae]
MGGRDYRKKRKQGLDEDTSFEGQSRRETRERREREREEREFSRSRSPSPQGKAKRSRRDSLSNAGGEGNDGGGNAESASIEETNKMRAQLGLAPLELDDRPKIKESESGDPNEKVIVEDGFEFRHKPADNLTAAKQEFKIKEKLEASKAARKIQSKVLASKGLADSDSEDESAAAWTAKMRKLEEEKKKAQERAFDELDAEVDEAARLEEERRKIARAKARAAAKAKTQAEDALLGGLIVGHSKEDFLDGRDTILVLQDKGVLDEDDEEVLINPNLVENEMHKKNVELKKRKDRYRPYEHGVDEFGNTTNQLLAKYDEELEGQNKRTFRLDDKGELDVEKEAEKARMRRNLEMASRNLQSLEQEKFTVASEFYTEEEMIAFRKPKKKDGKKFRKRGGDKVLRADDLVPQAADEDDLGSRESRQKRLAARRQMRNQSEEMDVQEPVKPEPEDETEEGELPEDDSAAKMQSYAQSLKKEKEEEDEESEDDFGGVDIAGVIVDDDAEDELQAMLEKTRRLKQQKVKKEVEEDSESEDEEMDTNGGHKGIVIDSTSEYCRNLGGITTYGLAGNRTDVDTIDFDDFKTKEEPIEEGEEEEAGKGFERRPQTPSDDEEEIPHPNDRRGEWVETTAEAQVVAREDLERRTRYREDRRVKKEESSDEDEYENALGAEQDVSRGLAGMLQVARQRGYLDDSKNRKSKSVSLKHLENKRFSQVETSRYDIDEKYTKKLERMGTTGSGPIRTFQEKEGYNPEVKISYTDSHGREMDQKQAFRELSWKFHGKGPGLKQKEKRMAKSAKKELMKKMNSSDTPLGTLSKQLQKQEQEQTPFIFLTGGQQLKKD